MKKLQNIKIYWIATICMVVAIVFAGCKAEYSIHEPTTHDNPKGQGGGMPDPNSMYKEVEPISLPVLEDVELRSCEKK